MISSGSGANCGGTETGRLRLLGDYRGAHGRDRVRASAVGGALSTVNLAEVVSYFARRGGSREEISTLLQSLPIEIVPFDSDLAGVAGFLTPPTPGIGLSL